MYRAGAIVAPGWPPQARNLPAPRAMQISRRGRDMGLFAAVLTNQGSATRQYVIGLGSVLLQKDGTPEFRSTPEGYAFYSTANERLYDTLNYSTPGGNAGNLSLVARIRSGHTVTGDEVAACIVNLSQGYGLSVGVTTGGVAAAYGGTNSGLTSTTGDAFTGFSTIGASVDSGFRIRCYQDGVFKSYSNLSGTQSGTQSLLLALGGYRLANNRSFTGDIGWVFVFDRTLSDQDHWVVANEPWTLLEPTNTNYFGTVAPAGPPPVSGTGDGTAPAPGADGSGVLGVSGSGEANAPAAEASGDGVLGVGGSGDADAPTSTVDGAGVLGVTGDGSADAPAPAGQGTGTYSPPGVAGSGDASAPAATAEGDGTLGVTGQGDANAPAATADGAGTVTAPPITGAGDVDAPSPEAAGDGVLGVSGSAEADAPAASGSGTGSSSPPGVAGLGDASAPAPEASGTGKIGVTGDGDADASSPGADGDGTLGVSGSGAASAPAADADGQGTLGVTGAGSADAPMATAEGTETVPKAGPRFSAIEPPRPVTATEPARNISVVIGVLDLMNRVGAKFPWEKRLFEVDFVRHLPEGVTITSCTVEVTAVSGTDPNAATMVIGSVIIDGTKCKAWIETGLDGVDYVAAFKAIGSDGRKMESKLQFLVTESA